MDIDTLAAASSATMLAVFYTLIGRAWWGRLIAGAQTPEEMELIIGSAGLSPWMVLGRYVMIGSWPIWWGASITISLWKRRRSMRD